MSDQPKKCKGIRRDGKPCEKYPLVGEDYCEKHHPTRVLRRKLKRWKVTNGVTILGLILMIAFFAWDRYCSDRSTEQIQEHVDDKTALLQDDFRQHSLAERILDSQYSPLKVTKLMEEVLNLMNNDPDFKKRFYIDGRGIGVQIEGVYGKDFTMDFTREEAENAFGLFIEGGKKSLTVSHSDYSFFYILKNGAVVDSFSNETFHLVRDFPQLPRLNISTVDPTGEYLCTSRLNIQVDSIAGTYMYLSNDSENTPFRIRLRYDLI